MRIQNPAWFRNIEFRRRRLLLLLLPFVFLFYFGSLFVAAHFFPTHYDWQRQTISTLVSPRDNPKFYPVASCGIALAGLSMLPFVVYLQERLRAVSRPVATAGSAAWFFGIGALILSGLVVPQHTHPVLGMRKLHEIFAHLSALGIGVGMLCCCWCAARDRQRARTLFDWKLTRSWMLLTLVPIASALLCQGLVFLFKYPNLWPASVYQMFKQAAFWHLGFWEWIGSAAVFLFFACTAFFAPEISAASVAKNKRDAGNCAPLLQTEFR